MLHGSLAKKYAKTYTLSVNSASEAVRALSYTVPGFKSDFLKNDYTVYVKKENVKNYLSEDDIHSNFFNTESWTNTVHIVPVLQGSKSNTQRGVQKLVVAAALFFIAGPAGAAFGAKVGTAVTSASMFLALNGISSLLTPKPPKEVANNESSQISADASVTGVAVPLAYGEGYFDVIPVSVEISSSGMNFSNQGSTFVNGGGNWSFPEYSDALL